MSWQWILVALGFGMFLGYMVSDLINTENKITYHIKRLRAKEGGTITVDAESKQDKTKRNQRRESRKTK